MSSQLPGYEEGFRAEPREVLLSPLGVITAPVIVDGDKSIDGASPTQTYDLRAGWLLGRVTSTGRWTPCKRTLTNGSGSSTAQVTVDDSRPFKTGDVINVGGDSNVTIQSINYSTHVITLTTSITWADNEVVVATDGSGTCRGVLLDFTRLRRDSGEVTHKPATLLVQGLVKSSRLLGDVAAIRADASAQLKGIRFSDEHGLD